MPYKDFIAGLCGGVCGVFTSHPIDTVRIRYQNNNTYKNLSHCLKHTIATKSLYAGLYPPLIGIGIEKCLVFGITKNIEKLHIFNNQYINTAFSGFCAGLGCTIVVTPMEKVKIMMQNSQKTNFTNEYRKYGITGLYRGWTATLFREVPGYAIYFPTYKFLTSRSTCTTCPTPVYTFIYGSLSGAMSWLFIYPADPVKTLMQNNNISMTKAIKMIIDTYGIFGFYRGFSLGLIRALPLHGGVFLGYEYSKKLMR